MKGFHLRQTKAPRMDAKAAPVSNTSSGSPDSVKAAPSISTNQVQSDFLGELKKEIAVMIKSEISATLSPLLSNLSINLGNLGKVDPQPKPGVNLGTLLALMN